MSLEVPNPAGDVGRTIKSKFKLNRVIGKGQWGVVYQGVDTSSNEIVAIKQVKLKGIPKAELTSIINEISLLEGLQHPNIVKYIDSETTASELFIVLEFVEKGSLQDMMKSFGVGGRFPEHLVVGYMEQVLKGLEYLHDQGVIHRDIKAANILSTKDDVIKVADFGVATETDKNDETVIGTPYWMAPEIIEMQGAKKASDIWSLGCTIIELLTGKPPYYDLNQMQALFKIVQDGAPPLPEGISPGCREFLVSCFIREPGIRPSASALQAHKWIVNSKKQVVSEMTQKDEVVISGARFNSLRKAREAEKAVPNKFSLFSKPSKKNLSPEAPKQPLSARLLGKEKKDKEKHDKSLSRSGKKDSHKTDPESKKASRSSSKVDGPRGSKKIKKDEKTGSLVIIESTRPAPSKKETLRNAKQEKKEKRKSRSLSHGKSGASISKDSKRASTLSGDGELLNIVSEEEDLGKKRTTSPKSKPETQKSVTKPKSPPVDSPDNSFSDDEPGVKPVLPIKRDENKKPIEIKQAPVKKKESSDDSFSDDEPGTPSVFGSLVNDVKGLNLSGFLKTATTAESTSSAEFSSEEDKKPLKSITPVKPPTPKKLTADHSSSDDTFSDDLPFPVKKSIDITKFAKDDDDDDIFDTSVDEEKISAALKVTSTKNATIKEEEDAGWDSSNEESETEHLTLHNQIEVNIFRNHMQELSLKVKMNMNIILGSAVGDELKSCAYLLETFKDFPDQKERILTEGILPILELLQIDNDKILGEVIHVVSEIISGNIEIQTSIINAGAIPVILRFWGLQPGSSSYYSPAVREATVNLLKDMIKTLGRDVLLKNFIGSWSSIIGLLATDFNSNKLPCLFGIQLINDIFKMTDKSQMKGRTLGFTFKKQNFCRLWARAGLLPPLLRAFQHINESTTNAPKEEKQELTKASENISEIILEFSKISDQMGDSVIRVLLAQDVAIEPFINATFKSKVLLPDNVLLNMLKALKEISSTGATLIPLQKAGLIQELVTLLNRSNDKNSGITTIHTHYIFQTLCQLCGYSPSGLEIAVTSGLIPHIKNFIEKEENKNLKAFALQMLFAISKCINVRNILQENNIIEYYIDQFSQGDWWVVNALEAISSWSDEYASSVLAKPKNAHRLHDLFVKSIDVNMDFFCNLVPSFYKMIKSKDLIVSLYSVGFFSVLLERVKYFAKEKNRSRNDVFVHLLQLVQLFYETVEKETKKEMISKYNLKEVIKSVHTGGDLRMIDFISDSLSSQFLTL